MTPFITFRENDSDGRPIYCIVSRQFPHYVAEIVDNPAYKSLILVPIPSTTLYLAFSGTLQGRIVPSSPQLIKEISATFVNMAQWYSANRVATNPKRFKKWLFNQEQPMS